MPSSPACAAARPVGPFAHQHQPHIVPLQCRDRADQPVEALLADQAADAHDPRAVFRNRRRRRGFRFLDQRVELDRIVDRHHLVRRQREIFDQFCPHAFRQGDHGIGAAIGEPRQPLPKTPISPRARWLLVSRTTSLLRGSGQRACRRCDNVGVDHRGQNDIGPAVAEQPRQRKQRVA